MKAYHLIGIAALTMFINNFSSCTPHFYQPKPIEPVLLTHTNQLKINAITSLEMSAVSLAYSPARSIGLQLGSGTFHDKNYGINSSGQDTIYQNEYYSNPYISAGYYKKISTDLLFESYLGIGTYNYRNTALSYLKSMKNTNLFLQPSIAYVNNYFDAAFTLRIDYLNRNKTITDSVLSPNNLENYKFLNYKNYFFIQPGITVRGGFKYVKAQFQLAKSIPLSSNYKSIYGYSPELIFNYRSRIVFSFGIVAELNNVFNKK